MKDFLKKKKICFKLFDMFQTRNIILNLVSHIAYTLCSMHPQLTSLLKLQLQNLIRCTTYLPDFTLPRMPIGIRP